jgi:hypothetical protein
MQILVCEVTTSFFLVRTIIYDNLNNIILAHICNHFLDTL